MACEYGEPTMGSESVMGYRHGYSRYLFFWETKVESEYKCELKQQHSGCKLKNSENIMGLMGLSEFMGKHHSMGINPTIMVILLGYSVNQIRKPRLLIGLPPSNHKCR